MWVYCIERLAYGFQEWYRWSSDPGVWLANQPVRHGLIPKHVPPCPRWVGTAVVNLPGRIT